jgi:UDP-2-acetamido-2-deoxy-ribo-hexuluronate aminotransferase
MSSSINLFDLSSQQNEIHEGLSKRLKSVLNHGQYIKGPEVTELEETLAKYAGVKHCITCGNGTDAIMIGLMALGIKPGDEILVPSFTYAASAEPISLLGAVPVFVEVDEDTFNFDTDDAENRLTTKTKGIVAASLYGQCADFEKINTFAKKNNLFVLEDGAQSFGAKIYDNRSCSFTDIATTSFFPTKPLGCYGDGGAIFTNDDELGLLSRQISSHGQAKKYEHIRLGVNSRLDTIQAAILLEKIAIFDKEIVLRNKVADLYDSLITNPLISKPLIKENYKSVYALYTLKTDLRDKFQKKLREEGIPSGVYYQIPLHKQLAFKDGVASGLERSETMCNKVLSIPMHPYLDLDSQEKIAEVINKIR